MVRRLKCYTIIAKVKSHIRIFMFSPYLKKFKTVRQCAVLFVFWIIRVYNIPMMYYNSVQNGCGNRSMYKFNVKCVESLEQSVTVFNNQLQMYSAVNLIHKIVLYCLNNNVEHLSRKVFASKLRALRFKKKKPTVFRFPCHPSVTGRKSQDSSSNYGKGLRPFFQSDKLLHHRQKLGYRLSSQKAYEWKVT